MCRIGNSYFDISLGFTVQDPAVKCPLVGKLPRITIIIYIYSWTYRYPIQRALPQIIEFQYFKNPKVKGLNKELAKLLTK